MLDLIQFCEDAEITIQDNGPTIPLLSAHDVYLMQAFADAGYRNNDLSALNQCRMYLKVVTLSDLCMVDGKHITYYTFQGHLQTRFRDLGWPRQYPSLPLSYWTVWRRALEKCFINALARSRELRTPLGAWYFSASHTWKWFFSPSEYRLYHREGPFLSCYVRTTRSSPRLTNTRFSKIKAFSC